VGWNSAVDLVYDVYFVEDGLEVGVNGHCSMAAAVGGVSLTYAQRLTKP